MESTAENVAVHVAQATQCRLGLKGIGLGNAQKLQPTAYNICQQLDDKVHTATYPTNYYLPSR